MPSKDKIRAVIDIELIRPYSESLSTLFHFCFLWRCRVIKGGTRKREAVLEMPRGVFKKIFGKNPTKGWHAVPSGADSFISSISVRYIITS